MQYDLHLNDVFSFAKVLRTSHTAAEFCMQHTLIGLHNVEFLENCISRMFYNVAKLHIDDETTSEYEIPIKPCRTIAQFDDDDLNRAWFLKPTMLKLCKYAAEDDAMQKAFASESVVQSIVDGIFYANYVQPTHDALKSTTYSIFNSCNTFYNKRMAMRDEVLAAAFSTISRIDNKSLTRYKSLYGNILCSIAAAASINTQYPLLRQFVDMYNNGFDAYVALKRAFGRTFKTLLNIGISPFEAHDTMPSFIATVGQKTFDRLVAENYDTTAEETDKDIE